MFESVSLRKLRWMFRPVMGLAIIFVTQGIVCETASAQLLIDRLRARINARQSAPAPQPGPSYQAPRNPNSPDPNITPRLLATPLQSPNSPTLASPSFGIEVSASVSAGYQGLEVLGFNPGSSAQAAGIRAGDLIVSVGGMRTDSLEAAATAQRQISGGRPVVVQVLRDGRLYQTRLAATTIANPASAGNEATATPAAGGPTARAAAKLPLETNASNANSGPTLARPRASLGIEARDATPQRGVLIVTAHEGAAGAIAGIQPGDRVVSAAGRLIRDTSSLVRELSLFNPGESVTLGIVRGQAMTEIDVEMGGPGGVLAKSATEKPPTEKTIEVKGASVLETVGPPADAMTEASTPTNDPKSPKSNPPFGDSLLGGVGSVIGDFFAGKSSDSDSAEGDDAMSDDPLSLPEDVAADAFEPGSNELPAPK